MQNVIRYLSRVFNVIVDTLNLTSPVRYVIAAIDIILVIAIIIYLARIIKKTRAGQIFKGLVLLAIIYIIAKLSHMVILSFVLDNFMSYGIILLIVVFQPELRNVFEKLGRSKIVDVFDVDNNIMVKHAISETTKAVEIMSMKQIGALIVFERSTKVSEVMKEGIPINGKVTSELLQNIFMPRTPLHDGAVVISGSEMLAAKCILPLASEVSVPRNLGTRHRAAVGITEISDALVVVVSEETGTISLAEGGKLIRDLTADSLRDLLTKKLDRTKTNVIKNIVKK
ncbi:MAG: diadenylate cyclase CdaA [Clostridia bacterium]|nr:diadenylate cyclase CdaA [Clostridia bacterium]